MKKYELTNETITIDNGKTLHRIRALIDIEAIGAKIGDLGGYIEKEENLSHCGNAWIYDNAMVYDNARIYDNAKVYRNANVFGNARIFGNAKVHGNAWVYGDACVYDNTWVCGDARICGDAEINKVTHVLTIGPIGSRNSTTTFFRTKENIIKVKCGCFYGTIDEFLAKVELIHRNNKHGQAYRIAAELAKAQIDLE